MIVNVVAIDRSDVRLRAGERLRLGQDQEGATALAAIGEIHLNVEEELSGVGHAEVVAAARGGDRGSGGFGLGSVPDGRCEACYSSQDGVWVDAEVGCCILE